MITISALRRRRPPRLSSLAALLAIIVAPLVIPADMAPAAASSGTTHYFAAPALAHDNGDGSMTIFRWKSTGSSFGRDIDYNSGTFHLSQVGGRVASGDVNGDGKPDIVMAYQKSDGSFQFNVFLEGVRSVGVWYTSGPFNLSPVGDRLVLGDFNGDGKAEPALAYDDGDGTMTIFRWLSTGSSFSRTTDYHSASFHLDSVAGRVAAGDVNGDGTDDIVMAYQKSDGTFQFNVFPGGLSSGGVWYTSGPFSLGPVDDRMVVGDFNGDGKAEPALAHDDGDSTMTIYRWLSTGSSFARTTDYSSGAFHLSQVANRIAAGDVDFDGKADIVMAYQKSDGTFQYNVFSAGLTSAGVWYTSGPFNLGPVGDRFVLRAWKVYTPPVADPPADSGPQQGGSTPDDGTIIPWCPCIQHPVPSPVCVYDDPNNWTKDPYGYLGEYLYTTPARVSFGDETIWYELRSGESGSLWRGKNACQGIVVYERAFSQVRTRTIESTEGGYLVGGTTDWYVPDNIPTSHPAYPRFGDQPWGWDPFLPALKILRWDAITTSPQGLPTTVF